MLSLSSTRDFRNYGQCSGPVEDNPLTGIEQIPYLLFLNEWNFWKKRLKRGKGSHFDID